MQAASKTRKVLLIESEPAAREVLQVLVDNLGCHGEVVEDGRQAMATVRSEDFDAVLLDLRSSAIPPEEVVSGIHHIRPSLVGRVLVITGEVDDQGTLELVERYFLLQIRRNRLSFDLAGRLRALLRIAPLRSPSLRID
ncbi:MAG TPA: response regulator [Terriglobia bacterium]|nr:response regulator [Terriglobia bacterium]